METKFFAFPCDKQSRCLKYRDKHGVHRFGKSRGEKGARQGPTILCQLLEPLLHTFANMTFRPHIPVTCLVFLNFSVAA